MAAEDIENKVRKMSSQKPEDGKDLQQFQEAQNQIVQINAERQGNLQTARLENNADAANNETMSQAVEMAALGGLGGGASVQQQVQSMNPQTQAVLGKYGLGQPKVQRTSSRSVQVTPQKITINNNTTNTTTNNVAVPAANIGGPVQGRTLAVKQNPDEGQARFKTWISNAFAKQNQQAAAREKEYQRREWSLTRSTNKLMKHLSDLGKSVSERLDPRKLASSVGGQFKTILFLFGTMFLAKNWKRIIKFAANVETFFFGEPDPNDPKAPRGRSGFSKMLISLFGGDPNSNKSTILGSLKDLLYTGYEKRPGAFDYLFLKIKNYFSEGAEAIKNLELPKIDTDDLLGSLKNIVGYFGNVISTLFTGADGLKKGIDNQIKEVSKNSKYGLTSDGKKDLSWIDDRADVNEKLSNFYTQHFRESYGNLKGYEDLIDSKGRLTDIARGDIIHTRDKDANNYVRYSDVTESGELTGTVGSTFRASNAVSSMLGDKKTVNTVGVTSLLGDIEKAVDKNEESGDKKGIAIESSEFLTRTGLTLDDIDELKKRGDITEGSFKYVLEPKTLEELAFEYKNQPPGPEEAALKAGLQTHLENVTGIGDLKKWGFRLAGLAGGIALCFVPGGQALAIPLIAGGLTAGELTAQASQSPWVRGGLAALNTKKARVLPRYTMRLVDVNDPRPGVDLGRMGDMSTITVPKNQKDATIVNGYRIKKGVINRIKDRIGGFKTKDKDGNVSYKSFDITDSEIRTNMDKHVRGIQTALHGKVAENVDYDLNNYKGIQNVLDLKAKNRAYEQEVWNNSPMKKSGEYIGDAVDGVKGYITGNRPPEKITDEVRKARILKAMDFAMKELGMTKEQAAGLVGNFLRESQLVTTAKNPDSPATGIAQWLGVRRRAFEHGKLSEKEKKAGWKHYDGPGSGKSLGDASFEEQLQFVKWEMENIPAYREGLKKIKASKDHLEAARNVFGYYEFSAGPEKSAQHMEDKGQDGWGSLKKGENFAGDALLTYNSFKGDTLENTNTNSTNSEESIYMADASSTTPDNYVEQRTDKGSSISTYDWSTAGVNSFGSDSGLIMAQSSILAPEKVTPTTPTSEKSIPGNTSESAGRELIADAEKDKTEDLYMKVSDINENIKLLSKTSIAQAEAINNVSTAIASLKFGGNINMGGGDGRTKVQSITTPPYRG